LREAMNDATPALGLYYREDRPTLDDALDGVVKRAGASPAVRKPRR